MQQLEKRRKVKAKKTGQEIDPDANISINFSGIDDNYDGFGESVDLFCKQLENPDNSKVLNSTFLDELKIVEVKDSDDEDFF